MNIVLLGIQGSGKGTQAEIMAKRYNLVIFEMGQVFRRLAEEDSKLGKKIKSIVEHGKLVPAKIVVQVLKDFLDKTAPDQPIIFDGVPRNQEQQRAFNLLMSRRKRHFRVVNIDIPEEETIKRLVKRMRHDDTPEIIRQRIRIFQKNTKPVIEKYRAKKLVTNINGNQSIEDVAAEINRHLDSYFLKNHRN